MRTYRLVAAGLLGVGLAVSAASAADPAPEAVPAPSADQPVLPPEASSTPRQEPETPSVDAGTRQKDALDAFLKQARELGALAAADRARAVESVKGLAVPSLSGSLAAQALAARGALWSGLGFSAEAESDFRAAVSSGPASADALRHLARLLFDTGRGEEALIYADHLVLSRRPGEDQTQNLVLRAQIEAALGAFDRAGDDLEAALKGSPDDRAALAASAKNWLARGQPSKGLSYADRRIKAARAASPAEAAAALCDRALLYEALKKDDRAERDFRDALAADPKSTARAGLAGLLARSGRAAEALEYAEGVQRAVLESQRKDYDKADAVLAEVLRANPGDATALLTMARSLAERRRFSDALPYADRAVSAVQGASAQPLAQAYLARADLQMNLREYAKAEADARAALKARPVSHDAFLALAASLLLQKKTEQAAATLDSALKTPGADAAQTADLLATRFAAPALMDAKGAAEDFLRRAAAQDARRLCYVGVPYVERTELDLPYFDQCVLKFPHDPRLLTDRGIARYLKGRREEAVADLTEALKGKPDALEAALTLSSILIEQGKGGEAREIISSALAKGAGRKEEEVYRQALAVRDSLSAVK